MKVRDAIARVRVTVCVYRTQRYLPIVTFYAVHIQLNEPLWTLTSGPKVIAMEIMGLCVQLEAILLQSNVYP